MSSTPNPRANDPAHGQLGTEQLRSRILQDRVPVMAVQDERTWRALVEKGQIRDATTFQATKAKEFAQENAVIGRMNHAELQRYAEAPGRAQQLDAVARTMARLEVPPPGQRPVSPAKDSSMVRKPSELDR